MDLALCIPKLVPTQRYAYLIHCVVERDTRFVQLYVTFDIHIDLAGRQINQVYRRNGTYVKTITIFSGDLGCCVFCIVEKVGDLFFKRKQRAFEL